MEYAGPAPVRTTEAYHSGRREVNDALALFGAIPFAIHGVMCYDSITIYTTGKNHYLFLYYIGYIE